jgi:serine/threonine-protein kinase
MVIAAGRIVANRYTLDRLIGHGSMGQVWAAHHRTLGERVALKLLSARVEADGADDDQAAARRFLFEAQVAARLSSKTRHIVRVTDHGEDDGLAYLVMELLEGETLEALLLRTGRLPVAEVAQIVPQIARGLAQAHAEEVVHRDLKPANVFLTHDEDGALLVKLLDFGIARTSQAHRVLEPLTTRQGFVFGTPAYMSPEQARASSRAQHTFDLWALAVLAYEALTGQLPVAGADADEVLKNLCAGRIVPIRDRAPQLAEQFGAFFERAFADDIEARFSSATELAAAFERAASDPAPVQGPLTAEASFPVLAALDGIWGTRGWALGAMGATLVGLLLASLLWRAAAAAPLPASRAATPAETAVRQHASRAPTEPWVPLPAATASVTVTPESLPIAPTSPAASSRAPAAKTRARPPRPASAATRRSKAMDKSEVL